MTKTYLTISAASVGTLTSFGTSTIMVPVLLLYFPLPQTLLLVGIIHWFGDIWKTLLFRKDARWGLIMLFGIPGIFASYFGASIIFSVQEKLLSRILGGFFVAYVMYLFFNPEFRFKHNAKAAIVGGALSGIFFWYLWRGRGYWISR